MNWYCRTFKFSVKITDVDELKYWNNTYSTDYAVVDNSAMENLRQILGSVIGHLNLASEIFKTGVRSPNANTQQQAAEILPDIANIDALHQETEKTNAALQQKAGDVINVKMHSILVNMIHMIHSANFTPMQVKSLAQIAQGVNAPASEFADEANAANLNNFLQNAIYNIKDPEAKSLRIIREILQNSADAAMEAWRTDNSNIPEIMISTIEHKDNTMDLIVEDNGIGMNWDILSNKFFPYFESGKGQNPDDAGGFGIAKALIQESPEQGWSIDTGSADTDGIHSSRFHKNMFLGTPRTQYTPINSQIRPSGAGTTLTLYKIPQVNNYQIVSFGEKYATNGVLKIYVNGRPCKPRFVLNELLPLGSDLTSFVNAMASSDAEKEIVENVLETSQEKLQSSLGQLRFSTGDTETVAEFFISPEELGSFYVILNDQYQFNTNDYISKLNIICSIHTNARPGNEAYPVDPGRENLRSPYKEPVDEVKDILKEIIRKITSNKLFAEGLNIFSVNKDAPPMSTVSDEENTEVDLMQKALTRSYTQAFPESPPEEEQELTSEEATQLITQVVTGGAPPSEQPPGQPPLPGQPPPSEQTYERPPIGPEHPMPIEPQAGISEEQKAILNKAIGVLQAQDKERFTLQDINELIESLSTPATISIQKNFISTDTLQDTLANTTEMLVLWQKVLKIVMDKTASYGRSTYEKKFIPGLIFSDEALALYSPPEQGSDQHSISINPLVIASIVQPQKFEDMQSATEIEKRDEFSEVASMSANKYTANRLAVFLFHEAIHELTHLLFPDSYGVENFHAHVSKMENICHFEFKRIQQETSTLVKAISKKASRLISSIDKDIKRRKEPTLMQTVPLSSS